MQMKKNLILRVKYERAAKKIYGNNKIEQIE
jgi:hypothetical protein